MIFKNVYEKYGMVKAVLWLTKTLGIRQLSIIIRDILLGTPKGLLIHFSFNGKKISFLIETKRADLSFLTEIFYFRGYEIKPKVSHVKTIVDIGAYKGDSAVYFSVMYPNAKIYCYEPNKLLIPTLEKNLKMNKVNFQIIEEAVSDKDGFTFFKNETNTLYSKITSHKSDIKVKLSKLATRFKSKEIDILKIDAEGSEAKILDSIYADKLKVKSIICEIHYSLINGKKFLKNLANNFDIDKPYPQYKYLNSIVKYPIVVARSAKK